MSVGSYFLTKLIPIFDLKDFLKVVSEVAPKPRDEEVAERAKKIDDGWKKFRSKIPFDQKKLLMSFKEYEADNALRTSKDEEYGEVGHQGNVITDVSKLVEFIDTLVSNTANVEVEVMVVFKEAEPTTPFDEFLFYKKAIKDFSEVQEENFIAFIEETLASEDFFAPNFGRLYLSEIPYTYEFRGQLKKRAHIEICFNCKKTLFYNRDRKNWISADYQIFIREK